LHYVKNSTITFNIDPVVYDNDGNPLPDSAFAIGAGFIYRNTQTGGATREVSCTTEACADAYVESVPAGNTWQSWFGLKTGASTINVPIHTDVAGYNFYWTDETGRVVNAATLAPNLAITGDKTLTLHYSAVPVVPAKTDLVIKLHTASYEYDADEHSVTGWDVTEINRAAPAGSLRADSQSAPIQLPDGNWLEFTGRDLSWVAATEVGTYAFNVPKVDFQICTINSLPLRCPLANVVTSEYNLTILPGGLTITPTAEVIPSEPCEYNPEISKDDPACIEPIDPTNPNGGDGETPTTPIIPGTPNTGAKPH
jgi:hypothetical protein